MKKKIKGGPSVVHGSSDKAQGDWMREVMTETSRKFTSVKNGKGHKRRTEDIKKIHANWDDINWGNKKGKL